MLVTSRASFLLNSFTIETSMLESLSSKRMLEQLPSLLPSQVSSSFFFHSLLRKWDNSCVVQHLVRSQILILILSSEPTAPTWTSIFLKIILEAALTAVTMKRRGMTDMVMLTMMLSVRITIQH